MCCLIILLKLFFCFVLLLIHIIFSLISFEFFIFLLNSSFKISLNSLFFFCIFIWRLFFWIQLSLSSYFFSFILLFENFILKILLLNEDLLFWRCYFCYFWRYYCFYYFWRCCCFSFLDYFLFWRSLFVDFAFSIFILIPNIVAFHVTLLLLCFCTFIAVECFIFVLLIIFHSPLIWTYKFDRCYNILSPNVRLWGF